MDAHSPRAEVLLEHASFVRALSRSLLAGEQDADDNLQQTWLEALQRPPRHQGNVRAWLGGLARFIALKTLRRGRRRAARERHAAQPERVPPVDVVAAELELQRKAVEAVMDLDEPYRSTVVLRYLHDLSPADIAGDRNVSVQTVKTRLRRALHQLRQRLDRVHGGNREAWSLGLLALAVTARPAGAAAGVGSGSALLVGGAAMKMKLTTGVLALCVIGTVVWVWRASQPQAPHPRSEASRSTATAGSPEAASRAAPGSADARMPAADRHGSPPENSGLRSKIATSSEGGPDEQGRRKGTETEGEDPAKAIVPLPAAGAVFGRVRLSTGELPTGVRIEIGDATLSPLDARWLQHRLVVGADGTFRQDGLAVAQYDLVATHSRFARHQQFFKITRSRGAGPLDVLLRHGGALLVRVTDGSGGAVVGEPVVVELASRSGGATAQEGTTDAEGKVLFANLVPGAYTVERRALDQDSLGTGESHQVSIVSGRTAEVVFAGSCTLAGEVRDAEGRLMAGVQVTLIPVEAAMPAMKEFYAGGYRAQRATARTDEDGSFRLEALPPGTYRAEIVVVGSYTAVIEGHLSLRPGQRLEQVIRLGAGALSGRVTLAATARGLTRGEVTITATPVRVHEGVVVKQLGRSRYAYPDDDGRYVFRGLQPGSYRIGVHPRGSPAHRSEERLVDFPHSGTLGGVDFALKPQKTNTKLRLTVLEPDGTPATGLIFSRFERSPTGGLTVRSLRATKLGAGAFEILLDPGKHEVQVMCAGFWPESLEIEIAEGQTMARKVPLRAVKKAR
jgi:RNA polymerase sigma-70 factor (ECF subfamily)